MSLYWFGTRVVEVRAICGRWARVKLSSHSDLASPRVERTCGNCTRTLVYRDAT